MLGSQARFGNIGIELCDSSPLSRTTVGIVRYHKNPYYAQMGEFLSSGWVLKDTHLCLKDRACDHTLPKDIFEDPEAKYTVGFVHLDAGESTTRLESVEDRLVGLPENEYLDFFTAYRHADLYLLRLPEQSPTLQSRHS